MAGSSIRRDLDVALQKLGSPIPGLTSEAFDAFSRAILRRADDRHLESRGTETVLHALADHCRFALERPADDILVRVFNPTVGTHGYDLEYTVVETCMQDQPFLLDSLRLLYRRRGLREISCTHPILRVQRSPDGRLERVVGGPFPGEQLTCESLMHFELERIEGAEALDSLRQAVLERLQTARTVVRDFQPMVQRVHESIDSLLGLAGRCEELREEATEAAAFLRWLLEDHFVLMGYEELSVANLPGELQLQVLSERRLGMLHHAEQETASPHAFEVITLHPGPDNLAPGFPAVALPWVYTDILLFLGKDDVESSIHRAGKIDVVVVRVLDEQGNIKGFKVFSGLFTWKGIRQDGSSIPILRKILERILRREDVVPGSHLYKSMVTGFNSIPVEYLFGLDIERIRQSMQLILSAEARDGATVSVHLDPMNRSAFVLVFMPRRHYDEALRAALSVRLVDALGATYVDHRLVIGEYDHVIIEFYLTASGGLKEVDRPELEASLLQLARPWEERFQAALRALPHTEGLEALLASYSGAFPESYTLLTSPEDAAKDVSCLEAVRTTGELQFRFSRSGEAPASGLTRLRIYARRNLYLTDTLPILDHFGLKVLEQSSTRLDSHDQPLYVDTFRVQPASRREEVDLLARGSALADGLREVLSGRADDDVLNSLVLQGELSWRQVAVLRAYISYARQVENVPMDFLRRVWLSHPRAARLLIDLFEARLDPGLEPGSAGPRRRALVERAREGFLFWLRGIDNAAEDRVLRLVLRLVECTLRTNFYCQPQRAWLSLKLDSDQLQTARGGLKPYREIYVHHPLVEGIHLRGGPIARGGIRWSDRYDDYRTEILDLLRTQMIKNVVIVPVGAKGGYVLRKSYGTRAEEQSRAEEAYNIFIRGLLDVTDNIVHGIVHHPEGILAWDGRDPYLVVAADKGTSHLSDTANAIAAEYGFWLGDAFASGGSRGFDHRTEGATARGAWESVRRHFRELGINPDSEEISCVGIGDMSGDVFGSFMLLSRKLKLKASFNHQHVFLDPDPDLVKSYQERQRLFSKPHSTWDDYRRDALSPGGGVFRRSAKAIPLSPPVQAMLGASETVLSGEEVVRRILAMPVDLLWNGGIGTYVKASAETNLEVGDRLHDAMRVNAADIRARVVVEGGNLGFTQAARVAVARRGGRINTDALDNSGGVDLSDHEVNLKILLQPLVNSQELEEEERVSLLQRLNGDVMSSVLGHNYSQCLLISLDEQRSAQDLSRFVSLMEDLEQSMGFATELERLPGQRELEARAAKGEGLTRPELCRLAGYLKMRVKGWLLRDTRLQGDFFDRVLGSYFPIEIRERFAERLRSHPLRQEIVATVITNRIVDQAGLTFFQEIFEDTGHTVPEIAMAWLVGAEILGVERIKRSLYALDGRTLTASLYKVMIGLEDAMATYTRRMLQRGFDVFQPGKLISRLRPHFQDLQLTLADVLPQRTLTELKADQRRMATLGLPERVAREVAAFPYLVSGGDIALLHENTGLDLPVVAWLYHAVGEESRINSALEQAATEPGAGRWDKSAMAVLRDKLIDLQYRITLQVARAQGDFMVERQLARWQESHRAVLTRVKALEGRILNSRARGVAPVTVLTEVIQELLG